MGCGKNTNGDFVVFFQEFLERFANFERYSDSQVLQTVNILDVTLSLNESFIWIFNELNIQVFNSQLDSITIIVKMNSQSNETFHPRENPETIIGNSNFRGLDLKPGTKAQITACYIDAHYNPRPTLITASNAQVLIQNSHFERFSNDNGSTVINGQNESIVILEDSSFSYHSSSKGVLYLHNTCTLNMTNSTIAYNMATSAGFSAITLYKSTGAMIKNSSFTNNSAMMGGALYAEDQCHVKLENNCILFENKASAGGALAITKNTNLSITDGFVSENQAILGKSKLIPTGFGGAIYSQNGGHLEIETTSFIENKAANAGAIAVEEEGRLTVRGCTFENNTVQNATKEESDRLGSFVELNKTSILLQRFSNKRSRTPPYYPYRMSIKEVKAVKISESFKTLTYRSKSNRQGLGGAILSWSNTILEISETSFTRNRADQAGSIFTVVSSHLSVTNCMFYNNSASELGGAIGVAYSSTLHITNSSFEYNAVSTGGGAIAGDSNSTLDILNTIFIGNKAYQGGAIQVEHETQLVVANCLFQNNFVGYSGGAVVASYNTTLSITNSIFVDNEANVMGGGVSVERESEIQITNCSFHNNSAPNAGGAVLVAFNVVLKLQNVSFMYNTAGEFGGAIGGQNATVHVEDAEFIGNKATQVGGAVCVQEQAYLRLVNCVFYNNVAYGPGGLGGAVIVAYNATLEVEDTYFISNTANMEGGGVSGTQNSTLIIKSTNFTKNKALFAGGLQVQLNSFLTMRNCTFDSNSADNTGGGLATGYEARVNITESTFSHNTAKSGAAILGGPRAELYIKQCTFYENTGSSIRIERSSVFIEDSDMIGNNGSQGAAFGVSGSSVFYSKNCRFWNNTASEDGGAGYVIGHCVVEFKDSSFWFNQALNGNGGALYVVDSSNITVIGTNFTTNIASQGGGGICVAGSDSVVLDRVTCAENRASSGGCLYLDTVTLTLVRSEIRNNSGKGQGGSIWMANCRTQVSLLLM